ncbi:ATP-binding protein [Amycolatopsis sacchari]|uniref:ATP-binding protein n=1 Tax=Amycolatopsis sacchari TaxID=115433 RepID=UPI003D721FD9
MVPAGLRFHRLVSVPGTAAGLVAALTAAHAELSVVDGALLAVAWQRRVRGGPVELLVGGAPRFPPAGGGDGPVLYPPGSTGREVEPEPVLETWRSTPFWLDCHGRSDPLWLAPSDREDARRGGFTDCVAHLGEPFTWLVLAEPAPAARVEAELAELTRRIPALRQRENSELDRVALQRAQDRYLELSRAVPVGTWEVRIAVGAPDSATCRRVAALLCAAGELDGLPYLLVPGPEPKPFESLGAGEPLHATAELLAALTGPPSRELPGIRVVEPVRFDVTPERDGDLVLGEVLDNADQPAGDFAVTTGTLNRHVFVAGATGSGKSQTTRHLLERLHEAGIPWLVLEPAKAEYARMAGRIGPAEVAVIRPGAPGAVPLSVNPLEPEPGFPLATHIDLVRALFLAAFEATEPFPQVLAAALNRSYTDLGWDTALGVSRFPHATPRYPDLGDLQRTALDVVSGIGYGQEVTDNVRGFIDVRLSSLRMGTPGRFFTGGHPLDVGDLVRRNVVVEIEDVGNDADAAFLTGAVLIRLHEHLRVGRGGHDGRLRHVTVVEEAHRLLKRTAPGSPAAQAVELFTALLAEIRAYGEGIVIAEQIPAKIVPDVLKNTALKIVHRLPAADDRAAVGATMNLDDAQSRHVVSLPPGRAAVFADGMDRPLRIQVPLGEHRESGAPPTGRVAHSRPASPACPTACAADPCTLRELTENTRADRDPELALWLELLTAAHVLGYPEPRPQRRWLDRLVAGTGARALACSIAQLALGAVRRRYPGLVEHYQPEDLARHVGARARAQVDGDSVRCDGSEVQWQAGLFRWRDVFVAFAAADYDPGEPHPLTAQWRARGLDLSDVPAREQLLDLQRLPLSRTTDRTAIDGSGDPPEHRRLAALLSRPGPPMRRFIEATRFLSFSSAWPLHRLYPAEWAGHEEKSDE